MNIFLSVLCLKSLRDKFFFSIALLALYRFGTHVPVMGVDLDRLMELFSEGGLLGFFNLFSGGGLSRFSIFALGILPYINASIIMQLMSVVSPKFKELSEEGESGRRQISQYTRYLAVFLSLVQAIVMTLSFKSYVVTDVHFTLFFLYSVFCLVAGSTFVMWLGEQISERGIGNGASILVFIGIISQFPEYISGTYVFLKGGGSSLGVGILVTVFLCIILAIVFVQEAERRLPVQYAKKTVGRRMYKAEHTYIPLRLIQSGVMPIIFASAMLQLPLMVSQYITVPSVQNFFNVYYRYDGVFYNTVFCFLIFFFSYFYTAVTFNPEEIADNVRKHGGFLTGLRPGKQTSVYLDRIVTRLTFVGALFLAFVALLPTGVATLTKVTTFMGLGGTALLIIVGVSMDLVKQIETHLISSRYENFLDK